MPIPDIYASGIQPHINKFQILPSDTIWLEFMEKTQCVINVFNYRIIIELIQFIVVEHNILADIIISNFS